MRTAVTSVGAVLDKLQDVFGAFYGATSSWGLSLGVLFVALAATLAAAWPSTAERYVDDEVTSGSGKLTA
jgi:hypothetical protein